MFVCLPASNASVPLTHADCTVPPVDQANANNFTCSELAHGTVCTATCQAFYAGSVQATCAYGNWTYDGTCACKAAGVCGGQHCQLGENASGCAWARRMCWDGYNICKEAHTSTQQRLDAPTARGNPSLCNIPGGCPTSPRSTPASLFPSMHPVCFCVQCQLPALIVEATMPCQCCVPDCSHQLHSRPCERQTIQQPGLQLLQRPG